MGKLLLDQGLIRAARQAAKQVVRRLEVHIEAHTTTSVERAVIRLCGIDGIDDHEVPLPNLVVEQIASAGGLGRGAAYWMANAVLACRKTPQELAEGVAQGELVLTSLPVAEEVKIKQTATQLVGAGLDLIKARREERESYLQRFGAGRTPYLYVIVATGNIYEDIKQARAAVGQGADIIAVIRSTGQSLWDYVPYGPTTDGVGGTIATQANFKLMRQALDEAGEKAGRYIRLTNYCSGLCMPEIAVMGALERLDVMLNDSMYGIIFRDINMQRTFVDQYYSRLLNGFAGIIINTGEDNYLTTADAVDRAHTVLASQFINEQFASLSCIPLELVGLGHAFEIDPGLEDSFLLELAQAQMVREIFPDCPIKYMPPTKFMNGNIFQGQVQDTLFNVASIMSGQSIHLLGMLTEAVHTPLVMDRAISIDNARYVFHAMRHIGEEISFSHAGRMQKRAAEVLAKAVELLEYLADIGLMAALEQGVFADISRSRQGGKGLDGVIRKKANYVNPLRELILAGGMPGEQ